MLICSHRSSHVYISNNMDKVCILFILSLSSSFTFLCGVTGCWYNCSDDCSFIVKAHLLSISIKNAISRIKLLLLVKTFLESSFPTFFPRLFLLLIPVILVVEILLSELLERQGNRSSKLFIQ